MRREPLRLSQRSSLHRVDKTSVLTIALALLVLLTVDCGSATHSEPLKAVLEKVYISNPQINAQRKQVLVLFEAVCQAEAGYLPSIQLTISGGPQYYADTSFTTGGSAAYGQPVFSADKSDYAALNFNQSATLTATQTLFDGFQTLHQVEGATIQVLKGLETLRGVEQAVLVSAATAYMDYLRDLASVEVQRANIRFLQSLLSQMREQKSIQDATRTDVAQTEARLAAAQASLFQAEAVLMATRASYQRIVGVKPKHLSGAEPLDGAAPRSLSAALGVGLKSNPELRAAVLDLRNAEAALKVAEGKMLPSLNIEASAQKTYFHDPTVRVDTFDAYFGANLTIPLYKGGADHSAVRQNKELRAQQEFAQQDMQDQTKVKITTAWNEFWLAKSQLTNARAQVSAAAVATEGVRNEYKLKFRTVSDVLNAQQASMAARQQLLSAEHDRVVTSYQLVATLGNLTSVVMSSAASPSTRVSCDNSLGR